MFRPLIAALLLAGTAQAQNAPIAPRYALTPYSQAAWTDPAQPGSGLLFELLPTSRPTLFGAYFTYSDAGTNTWLVLQGPYEAASDETRIATGEIAKVSAPLQEPSDGTCPRCPYHPPLLRDSPLGLAVLTFIGSGYAELEIFGTPKSKPLVPLDFSAARPLADTLVGDWSGTLRYAVVDANAPGGKREITTSCTIRYARSAAPAGGELQRENANLRRVPASTSTYLRGTVISGGDGTNRCALHDGATSWLAVDSAKNAAYEYTLAGAVVTSAPAGAFYLTGPNRLLARFDRNTNGNTEVVGELELTRVSD